MEKTDPSIHLLADPLNRRELAILSHLEADKSNQEIAVLETLALNSVKWYVQRLYAKLGVNKRSEAVERARELGLLNPAPVPAPTAVKNNLPAQLTSFIGRQKEIEELRLILKKKDTRLLTLTGSGGTGKTRLALQVSKDVLNHFPDGVWLVELAPLTDGALVAQVIASTFGLQERANQDYRTILSSFLRHKDLLLILDNCEHLLEAVARLANDLLVTCPNLFMLATSREALGIAGEVAYRVPSLSVPDVHNPPALEELSRVEAVRLFTERAGAVSPGFTLTPQDCPVVAQLVARLDGIPLAIELAGAWVGVLSVQQIAARLDDRFRLLTGGSRTALPRQRTLRASIDWSYSLLDPPEKILFQRLSIFYGGWTLEAAEAVCGFGELDKNEILDFLASLVNKSLVNAIHLPGGEIRYQMLDTIRQYAQEKLVYVEEGDMVRDQHLAYFAGFAERIESWLRSARRLEGHLRLEADLDNLRGALDWSMQDIQLDKIQLGIRIGLALKDFWTIHGLSMEGLTWLKKGKSVLDGQNPQVSPDFHARIIFTEGVLSFSLGDFFSNLSGYWKKVLNDTAKSGITKGWRGR